MGEGDYGIDPASSPALPTKSRSPGTRRASSASSLAAATSFAARAWPGPAWIGSPATTWACWRRSSMRSPCRMRSNASAAHARDVARADPRGLRGLHSPPRHPPPREGAGHHLCGRHRQSVLHDGHGGQPACHRDRCRHARSRAPRSTASTLPTRSRTRPRGATTASPFDQVLDKRLNVMDATAIVMCRDNRLPMRVFNLNVPGELVRARRGAEIGTLVTN